MIKTFQHPNGHMVCKVAGFLSAMETQFCLMFHFENNQLAELKIRSILEKYKTLASAKKPKESESVNAQDAILKEMGVSESANAQDAILKEMGVRWSTLNQITYWAPSKHVVLGTMHNWLKGLFQAHWQYLWKFVVQIQQPRVQPQQTRKTQALCLVEVTRVDLFSQEDITQFCQAIINSVLPSGLAKLPKNLGKGRNGKLKAAQCQAKFIMKKAYLMQCKNKYSDLVASLFADVKVKPNHHFSLNIPNQIRDWGPLPRVAEFARECLIGFLKKIKTNSLICKKRKEGDHMTKKKLTNKMFGKIYNYLFKTDPSAIKMWSIQCDGFKVATTQPNNCVVAMIEGKVRYGIVKQIYSLEDHHHEGKKLSLYKRIVGRVDHNKALVVSPSDVVSLAAYCFLPLGTFGIKTECMMLVPYDHQALFRHL
ncbi:hypothetical protein VP01_2621g3 [Puccinia sorghi]|uniref:Uncharacterized protein n=1 Tax=Puccinia sorghi TaxID=27349 RepID=A0A0L6V4I4_9BASI|nr:hypothetical protein VP01_2621g3 [Puccinia sorghi]